MTTEKSNEVSLSSSNEVEVLQHVQLDYSRSEEVEIQLVVSYSNQDQELEYDLAPLHGQTCRKTYVEIWRRL
ncbi:hypothetical protein Tco_0327878 [Tanacetum coccineum]